MTIKVGLAPFFLWYAAKRAIMNGLEDYQKQLNSTEWIRKRDRILHRDNHRCQMCGRGSSKRVLLNGKWYNFGKDYSGLSYDVIPISFSVSNFKNLIHAKMINIFRYETGDDLLVAISDNGMLGVVNTKDAKNLLDDKDNFRVNLIKRHSGLMSFALIHKDIFSDFANLEYIVYLSNTPVALNVHHKHYIIQFKAWEYADEDLVTLCNECHLKIHQTVGAKVYSDENGYMKRVPLTPCSRCSGAGYFPEYKYVEHGVCFRCRGARFEELIPNVIK